MKILILRFSSIGDIVLTSPVVRILKTQLPEARIHYATKERYASVLEANLYIDKLHVLGEHTNDLIAELRREKFDLIIDLHNNLRTRWIKTRLQVKAHTFHKLNIKKWILTSFRINRLPNIHIVDRYVATLKPLGLKMDSLGLDYFIPEKDEVELEWLPEPFQKQYVAFCIGGTWATKRLPLERMIELCDRINKPIVLLGGPEDQQTGAEIESFFQRKQGFDTYDEGLRELGKKALVYNACGKFNLNQSASLVKQASWVFTHDTGLMHIAAAFKKEIFSIWGNTVPEFGMYPYRTKFTIFENKKLNCRPCSKIGFNKCPKGHFKCMKENVFDFYLPD